MGTEGGTTTGGRLYGPWHGTGSVICPPTRETMVSSSSSGGGMKPARSIRPIPARLRPNSMNGAVCGKDGSYTFM